MAIVSDRRFVHDDQTDNLSTDKRNLYRKFEGSYIPSQQCQLASDVEEHDMRIINRTVLLETMRAGHENLAPLRRSAIVLTRQQPETSAMT